MKVNENDQFDDRGENRAKGKKNDDREREDDLSNVKNELDRIGFITLDFNI